MATSDAPIYMATVSAPTNIAVIKYWGKADVKFNTPINASLSVTLDQADLRAVTTVATSPSFNSDRLWLNGKEDESASTNKRFRACVDGVKALATQKTNDDGSTLVSLDDLKQWKVHVSSYNTFPTAAGLASSAAGYAALVAALAELYQAKESFPGELTTIARQGSGSACRSLYGGAVAWRQGSPPEWLDSKAEPVGPADHWPEIRAVILVVSDQKKDTSSTAGMQTAVATSTLLDYRAKNIVPGRMERIEKAWMERDFETFGKITMQDSNQFHATCLDTYPPIFYMNDTSRAVIRLITAYNELAGQIRVAYTFDAGPNAVLYMLEDQVDPVVKMLQHYFPAPSDASSPYIQANPAVWTAPAKAEPLDPKLQESLGRDPSPPGCVRYIYVTRSGPGPQVLDNATEANLDAATGLNTYTPKGP